MNRFLKAISKKVHSLSLRQVHGLSLLSFAISALALFAPLLLPPLGGESANDSGWSSNWAWRFCSNILGYASVLLPLYLVVLLARGWDYERRSGLGGGERKGFTAVCIRLVALGSGNGKIVKDEKTKREGTKGRSAATQTSKLQPHTISWYLHLSACFLGLQVAYLTWGLIQERMMKFDYQDADGHGERFRDSQFLVFVNRALGGLIAVPLILMPSAAKSARTAPMFEYVYSSLSNILSSWCQYEALVFVSFPTQVLAKASKIIPVMLMGKLVSRRSYRLDEYVTAGLISAGTALFLLSSSTEAAPGAGADQDTASSSSAFSLISGASLLFGYLFFDSFTSSWQSHLFIQYRVSSLQMMAGSCLLSCLVTVAAQLQQGSLPAALAFAERHPLFAFHLTLLSVCSTLGQLVIFHTIDRFGPVTFTIIMTVRQAFAILTSCLAYQHQLSGNAWIGIGAVFGALFLRIHFSQKQARIAN